MMLNKISFLCIDQVVLKLISWSKSYQMITTQVQKQMLNFAPRHTFLTVHI